MLEAEVAIEEVVSCVRQKIDDQIDIAERWVEVAAERRSEDVEATDLELAAQCGDGVFFRFDDGVHGGLASCRPMVAGLDGPLRPDNISRFVKNENIIRPMRAQDVLVACKLAVGVPSGLTLQQMSSALLMSVSDVHGALSRNRDAGLVRPIEAGARRRGVAPVDHRALQEFLVHGVGYVFPAKRSALAVGIPTALTEDSLSVGDLPIVWSSPEGTIRGESIEPLHKSVPLVASRDAAMHALLSAIDVLRLGDRAKRDAAVARITVLLHVKDVPSPT